MLDACTIFVFYTVPYRGVFVPRVLAGIGLIASVLQVCGVAMPLFSHDVVFPMLALPPHTQISGIFIRFVTTRPTRFRYASRQS